MAYSILVADEHTIYREGLIGIIEKWQGFEVIGGASDGYKAVELCKALHPDIALLDVQMPIMSGIEVTQTLTSSCPDVKVVLISMYLNEEDLFAGILCGIRGFLLKNIRTKQLEESLLTISKGGHVLAPEATTACFGLIRRSQYGGMLSDPAIGRLKDGLSGPERELLRCITLGRSNKEIGEMLYLGESTVKKQVSNLLVKLNMGNRTQAAVFALQAGIID